VTITASDLTVNNATPQDIANLNSALQYLQGSQLASAILQQLVTQGTTINIVHNAKNGFSPPNAGSPGGAINWDPNAAGIVLNNANGNMSGTTSAALGLARGLRLRLGQGSIPCGSRHLAQLFGYAQCVRADTNHKVTGRANPTYDDGILVDTSEITNNRSYRRWAKTLSPRRKSRVSISLMH
jgi:hypothetical protein